MSSEETAAKTETVKQTLEQIKTTRQRLLNEIHKVIVGQEPVIDEVLMLLLCRGHGIIEGVPGLAKTLMIRALSEVLELDFKRIQFTPDLMPSDITGTDVIEVNTSTGERGFRFIRGPLFANIVLADEINRTPPKTQSALLEAMQEYRVTVGGDPYELPQPFFVLATQNPIEHEGTYPLPEAQLDRFMFKILINYPTRDEERTIVETTTSDVEASPQSLLRAEHILQLQKLVRQVPISPHVTDYILNLVRSSRPDGDGAPEYINRWLEWGAGPRAAQYLALGAKARALLNGRFNVSCQDVRAVAAPVLRHRLITNFNAEAEDVTSETIVQKLLETVQEPKAEDYR